MLLMEKVRPSASPKRASNGTRASGSRQLPGANSAVRAKATHWRQWVSTYVAEEVFDRRLAVSVPVIPADDLTVAAGEPVLLEWLSTLGLMRVETTAVRARGRSFPRLELRIAGPAALIQRREHVRAPIQLDVALLRAGGSSHPSVGHTCDLSGGGARLTVPHFCAEQGTTVQLRLQLPEHPLAVEARVAHIHDEGTFGVAFERLADADREAIVHLVFERLRELARIPKAAAAA